MGLAGSSCAGGDEQVTADPYQFEAGLQQYQQQQQQRGVLPSSPQHNGGGRRHHAQQQQGAGGVCEVCGGPAPGACGRSVSCEVSEQQGWGVVWCGVVIVSDADCGLCMHGWACRIWSGVLSIQPVQVAHCGMLLQCLHLHAVHCCCSASTSTCTCAPTPICRCCCCCCRPSPNTPCCLQLGVLQQEVDHLRRLLCDSERARSAAEGALSAARQTAAEAAEAAAAARDKAAGAVAESMAAQQDARHLR